MKKIKWVVGAVLAAGVAVGAGLWMRREAPSEPAGAETRVEQSSQAATRIGLSPELVKRMGVRFLPAEEGQLSPSLRVTGMVTYDPRRVAEVGARIGGRVRTLRHVKGDAVKEGEVLAILESVELGRAQADLEKAIAHEQLATIDAKRARALAESRVSSLQEAEHAEVAEKAAKTERIAAEKAVLAIGGGRNGAVGVLTLTSPISGSVVSAPLRQGQTVEATQQAFLVADLSKVWVELRVFERDLLSLSLGDEVEVWPQVARDRSVKGQVAHIGETIDEHDHAASVRVELDNRERVFRPGLPVNAVVHPTKQRKPYVLVPSSAVTTVDGQNIVFVSSREGGVEQRPVSVGGRDERFVGIVKGLSPSERVAVEGVFALKSELYR